MGLADGHSILIFAGFSIPLTMSPSPSSSLSACWDFTRTPGFWDIIEWVISSEFVLMSVNMVHHLCVQGMEDDRSHLKEDCIAHARAPPHYPWGMQFSSCPKCQDDEIACFFDFPNDKWDVDAKCRGCGWKSLWVKGVPLQKTFL